MFCKQNVPQPQNHSTLGPHNIKKQVNIQDMVHGSFDGESAGSFVHQPHCLIFWI